MTRLSLSGQTATRSLRWRGRTFRRLAAKEIWQSKIVCANKQTFTSAASSTSARPRKYVNTYARTSGAVAPEDGGSDAGAR
jgi:hypothetical protein